MLDCLRVPSCNGNCDKPACPYRFDMSKFDQTPTADTPLPPDMLGSCLKALDGLLNLKGDLTDDIETNAAIMFAESVRMSLIELGVKA